VFAIFSRILQVNGFQLWVFSLCKKQGLNVLSLKAVLSVGGLCCGVVY
jgi:hypothetical protein